jgi:phosphoribosylaminoimidazolecarboxamide formyltransferase/IMP cyclohydrolase
MTNPSSADRVRIRRALLSVSDKSGLEDFARFLVSQGVELLSTGGSAQALQAAGLPVTAVEDYTGFPEMMDGRVKTLHPKIHGGLLALRDAVEHQSAMEAHAIGAIDLLAVNLYPFEETVAAKADFATAIENIDIGGPAMIRSAAKNHRFVTVAVEPADYAAIMADMAEYDGTTGSDLRRQLAADAFARTSAYDSAIATWFAGQQGQDYPNRLTLSGSLDERLRYGENPHQSAAFYRVTESRPGVATAQQLQGKALSYNNLNDTDAAFELVAEFDPQETAAVAIIKHANPCGVAIADDLLAAYRKAFASDPVSPFGGIVAMNQTLDEAAAKAMTEIFTEVIIAPAATPAARDVVAAKKNLRLLVTGGLPDPRTVRLTAKTVAGGLLVQQRDFGQIDRADIKIVTKRQPTDRELTDLLFAFTVAKHVKSNAIVYAVNGATVGVGAGQMSRVDSARIAAQKAADAVADNGDNPGTEGSVVASDAFFPFADGLLAAAGAGATAVIQPGGSMRDDEIIAAADEAGLAMVFTGMRHFRH